MLNQDSGYAAELRALTEEYSRRFAPVAMLERLLVDELAHCEWRGRQFRREEASILRSHDIKAAKALAKLHRMASSVQRNYDSTVKLLLSLRAERAAKTAKAPSSGLFLVPKQP